MDIIIMITIKIIVNWPSQAGPESLKMMIGVTCIRMRNLCTIILAFRAGMRAHAVGTKQTMLELLSNSPEYECKGESPHASQALYTV